MMPKRVLFVFKSVVLLPGMVSSQSCQASAAKAGVVTEQGAGIPCTLETGSEEL